MSTQTNEIDFILPVGFTGQDGKTRTRGKMRLATTLDEIEIHGNEKLFSSYRYHDILLLSRVITRMEDLSPVTPEMIEDLFEVDFRYLQTVYMQNNGMIKQIIESECPKCGSTNRVNLLDVYKNVDFYLNRRAEE